MTRMLLQTFLANDLADSVTKASRLSKYNSPGGGDYWWGLKETARRMINDGQSFDQAVGCMANITVAHKLKDNKEAALALYHWKLEHLQGTPLSVEMPTAELAGPQDELIVRLEPNFAVEQKGTVHAYTLWSFKDLRLNPKVAGMGVHMLELGLQHDGREDWKFHILDLGAKKVFGHRNVGGGTAKAMLFALRTQEELLIASKAA